MPSDEISDPVRPIGRRLHVAVVCRELGGRGSVPSVALRQAQELANHARVSLLSDTFPDRVDERLRRQTLEYPDFRSLRRFSHVPREIAFALAARRRLFQLQERGDTIDFVHCHSHALVVLAAAAFGRRFRVPCGLVAHGDALSSAPGTYDWRLTRFYKWAIPRGYARSDLVAALSPHMRDRAIACGAAPQRVEIIPNGIALEEIGLGAASPVSGADTRPPVTEDRGFRLLFAGTLNKRKGIDVLCHAAKALKDERIPFSLAILGEGPMRPDLERFIAANGLTREVTFHGSVPRANLGRWYQWADATCVPSLDDPLATVVLESLIAGVPVIGTSVGGTSWMVRPEMNGLLVAPGDPGELAAALRRICLEPDFLRRMRQASTGSVVPKFTWERNGEALYAAIRTTLDQARK